MVYSDRDLSQAAIDNLNFTSPLTFSQIDAEDLARDLDIFTSTQFFDFDFGPSSTTFLSSLNSSQKPMKQGDGNPSFSLDSISDFNFLSGIISYDQNCG